jgi:hypothetical protein
MKKTKIYLEKLIIPLFSLPATVNSGVKIFIVRMGKKLILVFEFQGKIFINHYNSYVW